MKKLALALVSAAMLFFGVGGVANAQYGAIPFSVTVTPTTVAPGGTVTVTISGCTPGETITVTLGSSTTTATCTGDPGAGTATVQLTAPTTAGPVTGSAVSSGGFTASFTVTVTSATTPPGGLPATGSSGISTTAGIAVGLLAVGLGLLVVAQLRRRHTAIA